MKDESDLSKLIHFFDFAKDMIFGTSRIHPPNSSWLGNNSSHKNRSSLLHTLSFMLPCHVKKSLCSTMFLFKPATVWFLMFVCVSLTQTTLEVNALSSSAAVSMLALQESVVSAYPRTSKTSTAKVQTHRKLIQSRKTI